MTTTSEAVCLDELRESVQFYWYAVVASLSLTFLNFVVYAVCLRAYLGGAPGYAAQFFFVTGGAKIGMGLILLFVLQPECPQGCASVCAANSSSIKLPGPVYGLIATSVGILWMSRGCEKLRTARAIAARERAQENPKQELIFDSIPTRDPEEEETEVEMTA